MSQNRLIDLLMWWVKNDKGYQVKGNDQRHPLRSLSMFICCLTFSNSWGFLTQQHSKSALILNKSQWKSRIYSRKILISKDLDWWLFKYKIHLFPSSILVACSIPTVHTHISGQSSLTTDWAAAGEDTSFYRKTVLNNLLATEGSYYTCTNSRYLQWHSTNTVVGERTEAFKSIQGFGPQIHPSGDSLCKFVIPNTSKLLWWKSSFAAVPLS